MKDATVSVGTSPEVLQHYLTAEPPIQVQLNYADGHRIEYAELIGLAASARVRFADGFTQWAGLERLLPVLRPFSALCQPLEDGTVPAVEVAKMLIPIVRDDEEFECEVRENSVHVKSTTGGLGAAIGEDGTMAWMGSSREFYAANNPLAAYDYLRAKHFALPVNGRPLVEGVDYIAKSAPATPTKQEGSV